MDAGTAALLAGAGFGAGIVNAVAGGGSLITFPALLAAGYPSVTANVTNALAVLPGYVGGSLAYRRELAGQRGRIRALQATSAAGAATGAALLLVSPASVFEAIVPWLILAACGLLAVQPRVAAAARRGRTTPARLPLHAALFAATVYGGYFGAGLGSCCSRSSACSSTTGCSASTRSRACCHCSSPSSARSAFAVFGPIAWDAAAIIGVTCLVGGAAGVGVARRLPAGVLRAVVIAYGVSVAIVLLV